MTIDSFRRDFCGAYADTPYVTEYAAGYRQIFGHPEALGEL